MFKFLKILSPLQLIRRIISIMKIPFLNSKRSSFCMWKR